MAKQLQLRRGTTAQHATFTGAVGEVTIDTDKDVVVVHDGATAGGFPSQKQLVSGTNIKTINDTSLLGSGNIDVIQTISVTNIDGLKDFVAPYNNYTLDVLGALVANDGGGGTFYYDENSTETANDIDIIEPTNGIGRWIKLVTTYTKTEIDGFTVKLTGDQTIDGIKTFSSFPVTPSSTPTTDYQVSNKKYVDNAVVVKDFLAKVKSNQVPSNVLFGGKKGISVLGDSITHGAFALNSFNHSWGRIFQKMANVELQSKSYGVINFLSLGSGATATTDIHGVNFTGSWSGGANGLETLIGGTLSNSAVGDEINITIPSFQNNGNINYVKQTAGGTFELYINGVIHSTTNTAGSFNAYTTVAFPVTDNGKGQCNIKIKATVGTVEISTIQYYKGATAPLVNLFATSGRKLRELTDNTIELVCANSSTLVMALGHNDTYTTDLVSRIDKLILECNNNDIMLVIPDFRWNLGTNDTVRQELVRLHKNVPNSIYIPFPELFKNDGSTVDGTYIVTTLDLFEDASHPNQAGHKIIAETIAKEMKFSVTSKEEANYVHNFVMPLNLNTGTTVKNVAIVSSVKWDKSNLTVNCLIQMSPTGAFPTGTHIIQTAWNNKYEVPTIRQKWQGVAYIRNDTGAIVSVASLNSAGELILYVLSSFITNQQFEFSVSVQ